MKDWNTELDLPGLEGRYGLPPGLLKAVLEAESAGNPNAVSPKGAQGLFQFMPRTANSYNVNPYDPRQAADGAARMFSDLNKQFRGDVPSMLAAYNWGSGNLTSKGMNAAPPETRSYIDKVQTFMRPKNQYAAGGPVMMDAVPVNDEFADFPDAPPVSAAPVDDFSDFPDAPPLNAAPAAPEPVAPPVVQEPTEPQGPPVAPQRSMWDSLKMGVQDVGRGAANLIGMPVDLVAAPLVNLGVWGANKTLGTEIPYATKPIGGSQSIQDAAGSVTDKAGVEFVPDEQRTPAEKSIGKVTEFATEAMGGGAGLARKAATTAADEAAPLAAKFLEAYRVNPERAFVTDTAAGAGSGAGVSVAENFAPDSAVAQLVGSLAGGSAGATTVGTANALKDGAGSIVDAIQKGLGITPTVRDPATGLPVKQQNLNDAAKYLQSEAADIGSAKRNLEEGLDWYEAAGLPKPATGVLSKDPGLIGVERRMRTTSPTPFIVNDQKVRTAQTEKLQSVGPNIPEERIKDVQDFANTEATGMRNQAATTAAEAKAKFAEGQTQLDEAKQKEASIAAPVAAARGKEGQASAALDKEITEGALTPRTQAKNEAFEAVDPEREVSRDATPVIDLARNIKDRIGALTPENRAGLPSEFLAKIEKIAPKMVETETGILDASGAAIKGEKNIGGEGKVVFGDMLDARKYINTAAEKAQSQGNYELADNLRALKKEINAEADRVIAEGGPGSKEAAAAKKIYEEDYAPFFAEGFGRKFRDSVQKDPTGRTQLPPSKTADFFLQNSDEAAKDLSRIVSIAKNPAAAESAVGNYMKAQVAQLVKADGTLEPATLKKWLDNNGSALENFPKVKAELDTFYRDVLNGREGKNAMQAQVRVLADNLKSAEKNVAATEARINNSALRVLLDQHPQNAAKTIINDRDPEARIKETLKLLEKNEPAKLAFKRAMADHLNAEFTDATTSKTANESYAAQQSRMEKFFKKPGVEKAINELYADTPDALNALNIARRIGRDMSKADIQSTAGSPTAELRARQERTLIPVEVLTKLKFGGLKGGNIMRNIRLSMAALPGFDDSAKVERLILQAQFDGDLALHLYGLDATKMPARLWTAKLNRLLGYTEAMREATDEDEEK